MTLERLPCGCRMGEDVVDGVPTFLYEPCSTSCPYYEYVLEESARQGKSTTVIDLRDPVTGPAKVGALAEVDQLIAEGVDLARKAPNRKARRRVEAKLVVLRDARQALLEERPMPDVANRFRAAGER